MIQSASTSVPTGWKIIDASPSFTSVMNSARVPIHVPDGRFGSPIKNTTRSSGFLGGRRDTFTIFSTVRMLGSLTPCCAKVTAMLISIKFA